jgi:glutamate dehydrogenase/leucine dehydrogenase
MKRGMRLRTSDRAVLAPSCCVFARSPAVAAAAKASASLSPPLSQGFGKVGGTLAALLERQHGRVVAVSDVSGGTFREEGLDVGRLLAHTGGGRPLVDFAGGTPIRGARTLLIHLIR